MMACLVWNVDSWRSGPPVEKSRPRVDSAVMVVTMEAVVVLWPSFFFLFSCGYQSTHGKKEGFVCCVMPNQTKKADAQPHDTTPQTLFICSN
jgi:hypothetical protein